jgi:hypothetical protein
MRAGPLLAWTGHHEIPEQGRAIGSLPDIDRIVMQVRLISPYRARG